MGSVTEFKLPDVGEGLTEAEIVDWHVSVGDVVKINDTLVDIETAKSVVELPSPAAGTVVAIHVAVGETVEVGTVLVTISDGADTDPAPAASVEVPDEADVVAGITKSEEKPLVLVGTGPSAPPDRRRRLRAREDTPPSRSASTPSRPEPIARAAGTAALTRENGLDAAEETTKAEHPPAEEVRETRTPVRGVRKVTAAAMVESAFSAPHVTEWLTVDVTRTMDLIGRLKSDRHWSDTRLTPLVFVARAFLLAIKRNPEINTRWDEVAQEVVQFHYVNLGIAAATPRGLIVPNIKDAHELDLASLASAMTDLVDTARAGRTSPEQMSGGTITITNIGALGVDAGTPILNPGEAAILAFGAVREMPWVVDGQIVPRRITQLAMSFDHRLVDGQLGSKVLADLGRILHDPGEALLYA
jgi:2-oxoisovalerate dehydrogenase E2 component (dihydrolipoyl transacylase)